VLEQQWQRDANNNVPTRPFLRLGTSEGFEYSYDPALPEGERITSIWLNGAPLSKTASYSVTVNSFLASGGDNFREFANGTNKADTGKIDLQAMVDYLADLEAEQALALDFGQHSVGATVTDETISLSSLSMTGSGDVVDTEVDVFDGTKPLGTFPVTSALSGAPFDESGTATIPNTLPNDGKLHLLRIVGEATGTDILVPVVAAAKDESSVKVSVKPTKVVANRTKAKVIVVVKAAGEGATGKVEVSVNGQTYKRILDGGRHVILLDRFAKPGKKTVRVKYLGNATTAAGSDKVTFRVVKK